MEHPDDNHERAGSSTTDGYGHEMVGRAINAATIQLRIFYVDTTK